MATASRADSADAARVIASFGRHHLIEHDRKLLTATRRGKRGDVVVGDRVHFDLCGQGAGQAVIESIAPRSSLLFRADGQRTKELAANVDQAIIVFAPEPVFNIRFVWRALIAATCAGIDSLVVLNKIDLSETADATTRLAQLRKLGYRTLTISARRASFTAAGALESFLKDRASLLIGQSGMGKSTLLNLLVPNADARTQELSRQLNLGKQTTTTTRWFALGDGGALIDSPGFQAFGLAHLDRESIANALPDFAPFLGRCRFLDCHHVAEPDCAISAAVEAGEIDAQRYDFYLDLIRSLK